MTRSCVPDATSPAATLIAVWPDPQRRSSETAGVSGGDPALSHALRAMLRDCSPNCCAQQRVGMRVAVHAAFGVRSAERRAYGIDDEDLVTSKHDDIVYLVAMNLRVAFVSGAGQ